MASENLVEFTVNAVIAKLKADMPAALAAVRADRASAVVTTEPPVDYFQYEKIIGYKSPCMVVVASDVDFQLDRGPNSVSALITMYVSCIVEDRIADNLAIKTYRYSDAMYSVLNRAQLVNELKKLKSVVKVTRMDFSKTVDNKSRVETPFRKEVMMTLEVEHYESET